MNWLSFKEAPYRSLDTSQQPEMPFWGSHIGVRTKAENFPNTSDPNFDIYVICFIYTNFEASTTFSTIFTSNRRINEPCHQNLLDAHSLSLWLVFRSKKHLDNLFT